MPGPSAALDLFGSMEGSRAWADRVFSPKYYPVSHAGWHPAHEKSFLPSHIGSQSHALHFISLDRGWRRGL